VIPTREDALRKERKELSTTTLRGKRGSAEQGDLARRPGLDGNTPKYLGANKG